MSRFVADTLRRRFVERDFSVARVGDTESADHLRELLRPYLDIVCFNGAFVVGSVAHFDGMLAHALGDRRGAEATLLTALRMHSSWMHRC